MKEQEEIAQVHHADYHSFDMGHDMMLEPNWQKVADYMHHWIAAM